MKLQTAILGFLVLGAAQAQAQALNPAVTQATVQATICRPGWAATVRPSGRYTTRVRHALCAAQGMNRCSPGLVLDHVVPLELGGAPAQLANFQMQTRGDSVVKDRLEHRAKRDVCAGRVSLSAAQAQFMRNTP